MLWAANCRTRQKSSLHQKPRNYLTSLRSLGVDSSGVGGTAQQCHRGPRLPFFHHHTPPALRLATSWWGMTASITGMVSSHSTSRQENVSQKLLGRIVLLFWWPELGHKADSSCKEGWKGKSLAFCPLPSEASSCEEGVRAGLLGGPPTNGGTVPGLKIFPGFRSRLSPFSPLHSLS